MRNLWLTPILALLFTSTATAAFSNYSSVLIGGRASGFGGAFTALTDDPSASAFYNPAGNARLTGNAMSANATAYNKFETHLGETSDLNTASQKVNRGFFKALPASIGSIIHLGSFAVGLSIVQPDFDSYNGDIKATSQVNSSVNYSDESLWVGGTMAANLTAKTMVGVTAYYTAHNLSRTADDRYTPNSTSAIITHEEKNLSTNSIVYIAGLQQKLTERWTFGTSVRMPEIPVSGEASYRKTVTNTSPYSSEITNLSHLSARTRIPTKWSFGLAYEEPKNYTYSFDMTYYDPVSYRDVEDARAAEQFNHRAVLNFAFGTEYYLKPSLLFRFGFFSNFPSYDIPDTSDGIRKGDSLQMWGFAANFSISPRDRVAFTFGGYYTGGNGYSSQLLNQQITLVPKSHQIFAMVVGTQFLF